MAERLRDIIPTNTTQGMVIDNPSPAVAPIARNVPQFGKKDIYIDFDMKMFKNPITNDIGKKVGIDSVAQSLKNLLLNKTFFEYNELNIKSLLFENIDAPFIKNVVKKRVKEYLEKNEKRILIDNIDIIINVSEHSVELQISFQLLSDMAMYKFPIFIKSK